jgi:hypothetical protein
VTGRLRLCLFGQWQRPPALQSDCVSCEVRDSSPKVRDGLSWAVGGSIACFSTRFACFVGSWWRPRAKTQFATRFQSATNLFFAGRSLDLRPLAGSSTFVFAIKFLRYHSFSCFCSSCANKAKPSPTMCSVNLILLFLVLRTILFNSSLRLSNGRARRSSSFNSKRSKAFGSSSLRRCLQLPCAGLKAKGEARLRSVPKQTRATMKIGFTGSPIRSNNC